MKKKVVQIVRSPAGGIRKHILTIVKGLEDRFDFYFVLNSEDGDLLFNAFLEAYPQYKKRILNLPIKDQPVLSDLKNLVKVYLFLKKNEITIVHGHGAKGGLYARMSGFLVGAKVCYTAHGGALHNMHGSLKGLVYSIVEKGLYYLTDTIFFESLYSMKQYQNKVNDQNKKFKLAFNSIKVPSNYDLLDVKKIIVNEKIKLGSFGLLRKIKGHDLVLKSIPVLVSNGFDVYFTIFGSGEEENNLKELSKRLNVEDRFSVINNCPDLDQAMKNCHLIIHPSLFESFGYVPLEANVNGISVVTSLNGGLSQVMDDGACGFCYTDNTVGNIVQAIETAIIQSDERSSRFNHFKDHIKTNFMEKVFLRKITEIYE